MAWGLFGGSCLVDTLRILQACHMLQHTINQHTCQLTWAFGSTM